MNQQNQYDDPKMQGQPPPYTSGVPPAAHAQPPQMMQPTVVHNVYQPSPVVVPMVMAHHQMSPQPTPATCVSCNQRITTRVESQTTTRTHLFALLLCLIGCWPCAAVPYFMDSCRNTNHYCPNCNAYLGSYIS